MDVCKQDMGEKMYRFTEKLTLTGSKVTDDKLTFHAWVTVKQTYMRDILNTLSKKPHFYLTSMLCRHRKPMINMEKPWLHIYTITYTISFK